MTSSEPLFFVNFDSTKFTNADRNTWKGSPNSSRWASAEPRSQTMDWRNSKLFTRLHWLLLENTQITDAGLENLKGLTQLQQLDLKGTKVTDDG